jgi:NADPH:quinone reductase-like Zn-dependent oxidoreductase
MLMKAVIYTQYGLPDVLQLQEVEKPIPRDNEVLIAVHAASINSWDWDLLRGKPIVFRLGKPRYEILGADIAGRVEGVGRNAKRFRPGDEVFGDISGCGWGGFAEYVCAHENVLALKPPSMTFEQAAAVPQAGVLALQGLRYRGQVRPGQKVLINGAGGGVGTFAVQMVKFFGAEVTAVDSTNKLEMLRAIGADRVIDYTREDFTKTGQSYDLILDVVAHRSVLDYLRALNPKGTFVFVGGSTAAAFQVLLLGPLVSITGGRKTGILLHKPNSNDLVCINELFEAGRVVPLVDRCYPLSKVPDAFRYFAEGNVQGKVVITLEHDSFSKA